MKIAIVVSTAMYLLLQSFRVGAEELPRYTELVKGMSPSKSWMVGANELVNRIYTAGPENACLFFTDIMSKRKRQMFIKMILQKVDPAKVAIPPSASPHDVVYVICMKTGLLNAKKAPDVKRPQQKITEDRIIDEKIDGDMAIVTARHMNNEIKQTVLYREENIWRVDGSLPPSKKR